MPTINVDNTGGIFMGCIPSGSDIIMASQPLVTQFLGDDTVWIPSGTDLWQVSGDRMNLINQGGDAGYIVAQAPLSPSQSGTTNPVTFRFSCYGDIEPPPGMYWNAQLFICGSGGMNEAWRSDIVGLPIGNFGEQQVSVSVTPPGYEPSYYAVAYIHSKQQPGNATIWDAEIFQEGDPVRKYAYWKSEIVDVFSLDEQSISESNNSVIPISFALGDISNIDDSYSVSHSISALSSSNMVITNPIVSGTTQRQKNVINGLMSQGIDIFGYVDVGTLVSGTVASGTSSNMPIIEEQISYCASGSYTGVYLDNFGYDYENTRDIQNHILDYVHNNNMIAMPAATYYSDVFMNTVDTTHNPSGTMIRLQPNDWYMDNGFYRTPEGTFDVIGAGFACTNAGYVITSNMADGLGVKVAGAAYADPTGTYMNMTDITTAYLYTVGSGYKGLCFTTPDLNTPSQYTTPPINVGNKVISKFQIVQLDPVERVEATTDVGVIWLEGQDSFDGPGAISYRKGGAYAMEKYVDITLGSLPNFDVAVAKVVWEYSPDQINWYTLADGNKHRLGIGQRYLRASARLYN